MTSNCGFWHSFPVARSVRALGILVAVSAASGCALRASANPSPTVGAEPGAESAPGAVAAAAEAPRSPRAEAEGDALNQGDQPFTTRSASEGAGERAEFPPESLIGHIAAARFTAAAVELEQWLDIPESFSARELAELRLARALVALEQRDPEAALAFSVALSSELPEFEPEISALRQRAQRLLKATSKQRLATSELLSRARRQASLGDQVAAWVSATSALNVARSNGDRAQAHAFRAELADQRGLTHAALADRRWLATQAPLSEAGQTAAELLEASAAPLTARERYARAQRFSELGDVERTEAEISLGRGAKGAAVSDAEWLFSHGWAYYRTRLRFSEAANLFETAARARGGGSTRSLYYAGRAWTRAAEFSRAIAIYEELLGFAKGQFRERAQFQRARTLSFAGRWNDAVGAYRQYLELNPHGESTSTAIRELGVALYASGSFEAAAAQFSAWGKRDPKSQDWAELLRATSLRQAGHDQVAQRVFRTLGESKAGGLTALLASVRLQSSPVEAAAQSQARLLASHSLAAPDVGLRASQLPGAVRWLRAWGFDAEALAALSRRASTLREQSDGNWGAVCEAYSALDQPARAYSIGYGELRRLGFESPEPDTLWAWRCAYPRPWPEQVRDFATQWRVPSHLVYAVMRQESGFRPEVVSPAGAVGLMQVMPTTAVELAEELRQRPESQQFESQRLVDRNYNLGLGTYYLGQLLRQFRGRPDLAVAAYNAGPQAVGMWALAGSDLPMELFWARIPFGETRRYVSRVLENWHRFETLYAEQDRRNELVLALLPKSSSRAAD